MRILYDHQIFSWQKFGGISRYFYELMNHSKGLFEYDVSGVLSENVYVQNLHPFKQFPCKSYFKGKYRIINHINKMDSNKKIKTGSYDIIHPTYYDPYMLRKKTCPLVITVYDMIHEIFPNYFLSDELTTINKNKMIFNADRIITISENTKNDIMKYYPGVDADKIFVVYLATSFDMIENDKGKENYILFTGQRDGYKNFNTFINALAPLLGKYNLRLICTGRSFSKQEVELLKSLEIINKVSVQLVNDKELLKLYSHAMFFVFPSLYEGFGIPVLEAFAAGCPALLSETSSLLEIGGEAALYFDPYSMEDMRSVIEQAIISPAIRTQLIVKGKEQVKNYSWKRCASETAKIYQSL